MKQKTKKTVTAWMAGIFLLSLIPLYALGFFAHPSVDDYYYGTETAALWQEKGDFGALIGKAAELTRESYESWQGNFAAIFLMRLQPGIWGEEYYFLAPLILLTAFLAGMLFFYYSALRCLFKAGRGGSISLAMAISFTALQFTYCPSDAFYWYNGGVYYTFFFSLEMLLLGLLLRIVFTERRALRALLLPILGLLAFVIGGGNYSTALSLSLILVTALAFAIWRSKKEKAPDWRRILPPALALLFLMLSFAISILAPGNGIRQAATGESSGAFKAIALSLAYGGYSLAEGLKLPVILMWGLMLPFINLLSRRLKGSFPRPLLVFLYTFGLYASGGTAIFYAQGLRMPPRMSNIIYFSAYLLIFFNLFYLCGWLRRRFPGHPLERFSDYLLSRRKALPRFLAAGAAVFLISCLGLWQISEKEGGGARFEPRPLSINAAGSLLSGEAARYDKEMHERALFLAAQPEGAEVAVKPLSAYPTALVHSEITENAADFKNDHLARFYHLKSVWLAK